MVIPRAAAAIPPTLLIAKYDKALLVCPCKIQDTTSTLYVENVVYEPQNPTPNNNLYRGVKPIMLDAVVTAVGIDTGSIRDGVGICCVVNVDSDVDLFALDPTFDEMVSVVDVFDAAGGVDGGGVLISVTFGVATMAPNRKLPVILIKAVCHPK
jgi:hypothetical protein